MWPRRLGAAAEGRGCHKDGRGRGPPPAVFANASVLRCDLPREGLGDDLPILHHEGIRPDLVAVVRRLGLPQDVGGVPSTSCLSIWNDAPGLANSLNCVVNSCRMASGPLSTPFGVNSRDSGE